ncbi:MAG: DUF3293 domain-containing protein [Cyanobacteria bacterium P01_C01_bin.72]
MHFRPKFTSEQIAALRLAYEQAVYEVYRSGQTIKLSIGEDSPQLNDLMRAYQVASWAIITASNPYSQCLTESENRQLGQQLQEYLQKLNFSVLQAAGKDRRGEWTPEQSFLILGIEADQAIAIGQKFAQNAIVYGKLNQPAKLIWVQN